MEKTLTLDSTSESSPSGEGYRVKLEVFEGPLDLLLYLIKRDEIDIYDIPISHITEQYLEHLKVMEELDIAVAGDFLLMASTLIYIKSKMLLPPVPGSAEDADLSEDPRAELVAQLLEHQKFKAAANMLYSRAEIEGACYTRAPLETDLENPEIAATAADLWRVFREVLARVESRVEIEIIRDEVTMSHKLAHIRNLLADREELVVRELFEHCKSRRELILTFLAFLELVKEAEITLTQQVLFGEIIARRRRQPADFGPINVPLQT
jgi:segregation and condensation protein A